jgi:hypothetical protein
MTPRKIFGPKMDKINTDQRNLHYGSFKSRRMEFAKACITHAERTGMPTEFWWESQKEVDNKEYVYGREYIEMDLTEIGCGDMNCIR